MIFTERPKHEQSYANVKEKYESGDSKVEKENFDSLDENKKIYAVRKREREMTIALSEEKNEDKPTNIRKSARLGLSEAKGFNNEIFCVDIPSEEETSQSEKRQLRETRAKNSRGLVKTSVKLKNGICKSMKR